MTALPSKAHDSGHHRGTHEEGDPRISGVWKIWRKKCEQRASGTAAERCMREYVTSHYITSILRDNESNSRSLSWFLPRCM